MAAAVDSLTENLQSVNEPLEGHYHNQNSLQENFECVNAGYAALEGLIISDLMLNMAETIPSWTENFQSANEALEVDKMTWLESVEKLYPQGDQDLTGKMAGVEEKQVDKMKWLESVEKLYHQGDQRLTEKMARVEEKKQKLYFQGDQGLTWLGLRKNRWIK